MAQPNSPVPANGAGRPLGELAHGAARGAIAAMAMTGMRQFTVRAGLVEEPPPQAIFRQKTKGLFALGARRRKRRAIEELFHWGYGAGGGIVYAALPASIRLRAWSGPAYGLLVWAGFEAALAPALGLEQAKKVRIADRIGLALDHLLYGLVLSETRRRPQR